MTNAAALIAVLIYLFSTGAYLAYLFVQKEHFYKYGYRLFVAGFACHTVYMGLKIAGLGHIPGFSLSQTLFVAAWCLAGLFILLHSRLNLKFFGIYVAPLVVIIMLSAATLPDTVKIAAEGQSTALALSDLKKSVWLMAHIVTIFIGEAAFALAFGLGGFYLIQEATIKNKRRGFFYRRLPSLELLDAAGYACLVVGFTMLTLGLITGIVYARMIWGRFWGWDPKEVWSGITWLVYAALLHQRLVVGWRGRRAAIMAIVGFGLLLFTFLGVNFLLEGHHGIFTTV
ncbi:MAG: c-type cytochrome biogenesis protein CcsB [Thermodesulfobacteriota bacterium]|nr:c-type cytochrome biogenesis protein CcsB [Thermodesulfobacteriota bacterium]